MGGGGATHLGAERGEQVDLRQKRRDVLRRHVQTVPHASHGRLEVLKLPQLPLGDRSAADSGRVVCAGPVGAAAHGDGHGGRDALRRLVGRRELRGLGLQFPLEVHDAVELLDSGAVGNWWWGERVVVGVWRSLRRSPRTPRLLCQRRTHLQVARLRLGQQRFEPRFIALRQGSADLRGGRRAQGGGVSGVGRV